MKEVISERPRNYCGAVTNTDIWREFALRMDDVK